MNDKEEKNITKESKDNRRDRLLSLWIAIIGAIALVVSAIIQIYPDISPNTPKEISNIKLEQIAQEIKAFSGTDGTVSSTANLQIAYEEEYIPKYILNYDIPEASLGFAGVAFEFRKSISVVDYDFVQFTVEFSHLGDDVEIYLADLAGNRAAVRISDNGSGKVESSVPLKNFGDVDLNALSEINFFTRNETENGGYDIVVSNIRFSK